MVIGLSVNEKYQQSLRALLISPLNQLVNDSSSCRVSLPLTELFLFYIFILHSYLFFSYLFFKSLFIYLSVNLSIYSYSY